MKNTALQIVSVIGLVVLMSVVSARAQTQYRVQIPFDFTIGHKNYEAGAYSIEALNTDSAAHRPLAIRDMKGRNSHIIMTTPGDGYLRVEDATLAFDRSETGYALSYIRTPSFAAKLPQMRAAKETLARNPDAQQKIVALSIRIK